MKAYVESLRLSAERVERDRKANERGQAEPRTLCAKPLTDQIEELMRSLSPMQRDRAWTMEEFVARLHGRYRARPHPMRVGEALRALGWSMKRDWTNAGRGRRYWLPRAT